MTQMPQTGANMQGTPNGLFQFQEGNDTMVMRQEQTCAASHKVKSSQSHDFDFPLQKKKSKS